MSTQSHAALPSTIVNEDGERLYLCLGTCGTYVDELDISLYCDRCRPAFAVDEANIAIGEHLAEAACDGDHKASECSTCEDLGDLYAEAREAAANYGQSPEEDLPWCDFCGGEGHTAILHDA